MGQWEYVLESGEDERRLTDGFCVEIRRVSGEIRKRIDYADIDVKSHIPMKFNAS